MKNEESREAVPKDQEWIYYKDFEEQLYSEPPVDLEILPITKGPYYHWFGYYDKFQIDTSNSRVLGMEVNFDKRSPLPEDRINIGIIHLEERSRWEKIGTSNAWGWQQGCMLQWRPAVANQIMWNDRVADRFVTKLYNCETGELNEIPYPFYHVSPDGTWALGTDFARIQDMRPGYGYPGIEDPNRSLLRPETSGVYKIDLETGAYTFLFSVADVAGIPYKESDEKDDKHYFNHICVNPNGSRFIFLHRWKSVSKKWPGFKTRLFTASPGIESNVKMVSDTESISHFIWKNASTILVWANGGFRYFYDAEKSEDPIVLNAPNGHQSYFPGSPWILADTYRDVKGNQNLYIFNEDEKKIIPIARLHEPDDYYNEWRCDLHPRISRDGSMAIVDSVHNSDEGRQMYLVDLRPVINEIILKKKVDR